MSNHIYQEWVELIQTEGRNLTKWELDFVDSIAEQLGNGRQLSDRQIEHLDRIYTEKTP